MFFFHSQTSLKNRRRETNAKIDAIITLAYTESYARNGDDNDGDSDDSDDYDDEK